MNDIEKLIEELEVYIKTYEAEPHIHREIVGTTDVLKKAVSTIEELSEKEKWHLVSEGDLPIEPNEVIITQKFRDGHTNVTTASYIENFCGNKKKIWTSNGYKVGNVMAWKPLPEPCKKEVD